MSVLARAWDLFQYKAKFLIKKTPMIQFSRFHRCIRKRPTRDAARRGRNKECTSLAWDREAVTLLHQIKMLFVPTITFKIRAEHA